MTKINWNFDLLDHPVNNWADIRIETPSIHKLREDIMQFVWTYAPGAAVVGFSRAGKSTALEIIGNKVTTRKGKKVPFVYYSALKQDGQTIRAMYESICDFLFLPMNKRPDLKTMKKQLITYIAEKAFEYSTQQVILVVDEAQRLSIRQIDVFSDIHDHVKIFYKVHPVIIFVGNLEQLTKLLERIVKGENEHLEGRFFKRLTVFRGLDGVADIKYCLNHYDRLRYPLDGPTYTQAFLKNEWDSGFRYSSLAPLIWSVFREYQKYNNLDSWGTENFIGSVSVLLSDYLPRYGIEENVDEMVKNSINACRLTSSVVNFVQ
ncbi:MAG: ATP-binding protein [Candidatus Thiodiazotropha endolucinida]